MLAMRASLVFFVLLGWGCTAGSWGGKTQQPGTPLSDEEYRQFFRLLRVAHRARAACLIRVLYGCQNPLIQRLDAYENHGVIPEGPVCSRLPGTPSYPNFCTFSIYRCTRRRYFIQRTACPEETTAGLGATQAFNDMTTGSDAMLSGIFSPQALFPTFPKTVQPANSIPNTEGAVIPTSLPALQNTQLNPPDSHATEMAASGQQQGRLPASDIQDLLLRLLDKEVQSLLQKLQTFLRTEKAGAEEELQAAALQLLQALNNTSVSVANHH